MKHRKFLLAILLAACLLCALPTRAEEETPAPEWSLGFARRQIIPAEDSEQPLYIAGYHNGWEISDVLDYCEARAVWLDAGGDGVLLIGIDCIALDSGTVQQIREAVGEIPNCRSVNVYATHTHAGPDTLGLWGPTGVNGKNSDYMDALIAAAAEAGREAVENAEPGRLYFGQTETVDMCHDSRSPRIFDPNLYQLRFESKSGGAGTRICFYGAHAEALRGDNRLLSRDFPGLLCDRITEETGDHAMFCPGPIGGLIMTREFVARIALKAQDNLALTAERLVAYARAITPETERELAPALKLGRTVFSVPLDNPVFALYKFLGILNAKSSPADSATGYGIETELSVLMLGDLAVVMLPGEIFPELVLGGAYGDANPDGVNPRPLTDIARENGVDQMIVIGLCNDEIGYIVPPSDFLINEKTPYIERKRDKKGEDHYEETNSVGPDCAQAVADAFEAALKNLR